MDTSCLCFVLSDSSPIMSYQFSFFITDIYTIFQPYAYSFLILFPHHPLTSSHPSFSPLCFSFQLDLLPSPPHPLFSPLSPLPPSRVVPRVVPRAVQGPLSRRYLVVTGVKPEPGGPDHVSSVVCRMLYIDTKLPCLVMVCDCFMCAFPPKLMVRFFFIFMFVVCGCSKYLLHQEWILNLIVNWFIIIFILL